MPIRTCSANNSSAQPASTSDISSIIPELMTPSQKALSSAFIARLTLDYAWVLVATESTRKPRFQDWL